MLYKWVNIDNAFFGNLWI